VIKRRPYQAVFIENGENYKTTKNVLITGGYPVGTLSKLITIDTETNLIVTTPDEETEIRINVMKAISKLRGEEW